MYNPSFGRLGRRYSRIIIRIRIRYVSAVVKGYTVCIYIPFAVQSEFLGYGFIKIINFLIFEIGIPAVKSISVSYGRVGISSLSSVSACTICVPGIVQSDIGL